MQLLHLKRPFAKAGITTLSAILYFYGTATGQQIKDSTVRELAPLHIKTYFHSQPGIELPASAQVIDRQALESLQPSNMLNAINTVPGIRMEERSPGSFRIALRGNMLRSPFGVRNTKVYLDEIPLTDAGGNTYLNLIEPVGINNMFILKGPDGSLFGANSGGVIRIAPEGLAQTVSPSSLQLSGGSFGNFNQQLHLGHQRDGYRFSIDQAFIRSDGYRQQSGLNKKFLQTAHHWDYSTKGILKLLVLATDLDYQTPGGLTEAQWRDNPRQARPATPATPSAVEQQAGIRNKTLLSGVTHQYQFDHAWQHSLTVFGSMTDLTNPFITNYEMRDERNVGTRSYLSYTDERHRQFTWQWQIGLELQSGRYDIHNYDNNRGTRGALQEQDKIFATQQNYFTRLSGKIDQKLTVEASIGLNYNDYRFETDMPNRDVPVGEASLPATWMPRIAASYQLQPNIALRGSISQGYSPPTVAEIRPSDNRINTDLRAETGTNYEVGLRAESPNKRFIADVSLYSYKMKEGIVPRRTESEAEYFVNAGQLDQKGVEAMLIGQLIEPDASSWIQALTYTLSLTYQHYIFADYTSTNTDYSGNRVTSTPDWIWVNAVKAVLPKDFSLNILHNYTAAIPLNDANTVYADAYHLLQSRLDWTKRINNKWGLQFFAGVDNALNQNYSLGNDINAFGGRYFNPAPTRNYYGGIKAFF